MTEIYYIRYLEQLGFTQSEINQSITPDLNTLKRLQFAHLSRYPFQSLTTVLGKPVELEEDVIYEKLIEHREGGYCYELNGLFLSLLDYLGYEARVVTGFVILDNQFEIRNARTHMALMVTIDDNIYLVDVGFGSLAPSEPLLFTFNQEDVYIQITSHGRYKIIKDESVQDCVGTMFSHTKANHDRYIVCCEVESEWKMLYAFDFFPQAKIDLIVGNWYISTHPNSPFKNKLMASRLDKHGVRHTLMNNQYQRHQVGKPSQSKMLDGVEEILAQLKDVFLMDGVSRLTPGERQDLTNFLRDTV